MVIYAVWNIRHRTFLRWGVNGGGEEGYCLFLGRRCFFCSRKAAEDAIGKLDRPKDFELRRFVEEDGGVVPILPQVK